MPDSSVDQPQAGLERLHDAVNQLSELVRDAARKSVALETRIEALPGPKDIAVAVEAELERTVREARDAIDARVGQLAGDLDTLERRLTEIGDALVPLEGLRTEIATVADQSSSFTEIRAAIADAVSRISSAAPSSSGPSERAGGVDTDELLAGFRGALDTTVATIRADFEVLVRAEQQEAEKRIDALGLRITNLSMSVSKALEDLVGHSARIDDRAHLIEGENAAILEAVRKEVAAAVTAAGEEVRVHTESLSDALSARAAAIESSLTDRVASFEAGLAERVEALQSSLVEQFQALTAGVGALPTDISSTLAEINRTIAGIGDLGAVQTAIETAAEQLRAEQAGQLEEIRSGQARALEDIRSRQTRALDEIKSGKDQNLEQLGTEHARALEEVGGGQLRALEQLRLDQAEALAKLSEDVADVAPSVARALADVREALGTSSRRTTDEVESAREQLSRGLADVRDALGTSARRTSGEITQLDQQLRSAIQRSANVLEGLRSPLKEAATAAGSMERSRVELAAAIAALDEHLVQRTAGVKGSITERAARLEGLIEGLPGSAEVAGAVAQHVGQSLTEIQRKADESADGLRHDMTGITSNVNEIWMRVRTMGQGLEELRAASKEDAGTLVAMIEEMAQSEERSAARLAEAERRFVGAVRQIEHERDRVFIQTMNEFLEELPRRERKRMGKRLRALGIARHAKEAPAPDDDIEPLAPEAPVSVVELSFEEHPVPVEPPAAPAPKRKPRKRIEQQQRSPKKAAPVKPVKKQSRAALRAVEPPSKPRKQREPKAESRTRTRSDTGEPMRTETVPEAPIEPDQSP